MLHGECVSIGCVWEAELAVRMGHLEAAHVPVIRRCFEQLGTPGYPGTSRPGLRNRAMLMVMLMVMFGFVMFGFVWGVVLATYDMARDLVKYQV